MATRLLAVFIFAFACLGQASSVMAASSDDLLVCRLQKEVRTLRIHLDGSDCVAFYTKSGKEEQVAKSGTPDKCKEVVGQIRTNLEKSAWVCKAHGSDRVSFTLGE